MKYLPWFSTSILIHFITLFIPFSKKESLFLDESSSIHSLNVYLKTLPAVPVKRTLLTQSWEKHIDHEGKKGTLTAAKLIGHLHPLYPLRSRRLGHQGPVIVRAKINEYGQVDEVFIIKSSGFYELDQEAKRALEEALFSAAEKNGLALKDEQEFTFKFQLKE